MARPAAAGLILALLLAGCNQQKPAANDEMKKDLDQLVQASKDLTQQAKDTATSSKATTEAVKALSDKLDALQKAVTGGFAGQKRGALAITLDSDTECKNDESCENTARAICNKINYPSAVTSKYTPGVRPTLHSLICYD